VADYRYTDLDSDPEVQADVEFLREMLGPFDPAGNETGMPTPQQAREHIARVLAESREGREARSAKPAPLRPSTRPGRRHSRRRVLALAGGGAVAAAAATAGLLAVDLRRARPAYAATPQALVITAPRAGDPGPESLEQLAANAGNAGDATAVDHLVTERWGLNSTIDGRRVTSAIIATRRQLWRTRAGQVRTIDEYLPPQFPTAADRDNWRDDGSPRGGGETREDYRAGEFTAAFPGRPPLRTDTLAQWLRRADTSDVAIINGTADLLNERALTGPERAALLRVLARRTTLTYAGTTVDRAGRTGRAFTTTSDSSGAEVTHLFVVDPGTARIFAYEQILTAGGDALRVRRPAVISYRTYLTAEFVPAIP
jgi:hypothetical protein